MCAHFLVGNFAGALSPGSAEQLMGNGCSRLPAYLSIIWMGDQGNRQKNKRSRKEIDEKSK
jgi:hypothetical protein